MNSSRIDVIRTWFILITLRELQVFLEFVNFYRRFVKKFARITKLMTKLLKDNKQKKQNEFFVFNIDVVKTFRKLLKTFIEILMLIHFDSKNKIRIETNVFEFVIATILSQLTQRMKNEKNFVWHFVIFYFRKMISAKTRYEIHDQKLLFIIIAFQQWKHYLKNNRYLIEILTNHNNSRYFMITIILNRRQTRWFLIFAKYDFEIKYRVKKINFVDESSRRSNYESEIDDELCLLTLQNKLKNIFVIAIEFYLVVTRDIARAHESRSKNVIISSWMKEIKNDSSKLFFEKNEFD